MVNSELAVQSTNSSLAVSLIIILMYNRRRFYIGYYYSSYCTHHNITAISTSSAATHDLFDVDIVILYLFIIYELTALAGLSWY